MKQETIFTINHSHPEEFNPCTEVVGVAATHDYAVAMATAYALTQRYSTPEVFHAPDWEAFKTKRINFVYIEEVTLNCFINEHDQRSVHIEAPVFLKHEPTPVLPTKATKFYHYSQNNSGGSFIVNERVGNDVVIEARDVDHANTIAESIGIYFDGAGDCPCCGNRWSEANESDGETFPHCYGEKLETLEVSWCRREVYVYYLGSDKPKIIKLKLS
jgi:hypothetical protein